MELSETGGEEPELKNAGEENHIVMKLAVPAVRRCWGLVLLPRVEAEVQGWQRRRPAMREKPPSEKLLIGDKQTRDAGGKGNNLKKYARVQT